MKIGVFDSGVGGLSVAKAIERALPEHEVVFKDDHEHVPYGTRTPREIFNLAVPILQSMIDEGCTIIVVACNTVSTTLAAQLKERFSVPLVTLVPMIKPAAFATKTGVIAVCATPTTLASPRYKELKEEFASNLTVLEPDCSDWATMIEQTSIDETNIRNRLQEVLDKHADVIVLGCTHYHWIENVIKGIAGDKAAVIQPEKAIVNRVKQLIDKINDAKK